MLSLDQVLRLLMLPAVAAAFSIASHVSEAMNAPPVPVVITGE